jgi:SagB-type dehydrogenase family enzyme
MSEPTPPSPLDQVKQYHQQTKHDFNRYARSLGYLDWANQPNPFRRYAGATVFQLPLLSLDEEPTSPPYEAIYSSHRLPVHPVTVRTLSRFFEYALSLTAWKEYGNTRWALRSNPSSGNLHPTEGYLLLGAMPHVPSWSCGLFHYAPQLHALEQRCRLAPEAASKIFRHLPPDGFLVGLSSIHWREAWKYGERAFRYCQHDTGHAIGTLRIAARTLGWTLQILDAIDDDTISHLLGIGRGQDFEGAEREYPELLAAVWPSTASPFSLQPLIGELTGSAAFSSGDWEGQANRLSQDDPVAWEIIDLVTQATWKQAGEFEVSPDTLESLPDHSNTKDADFLETSTETEPDTARTAGRIIHQRRSAVAFDGRTGLPADRFFLMLDRILPYANRPLPQRPVPWDALPWNPTVHLALFIHRVDGLEPGLYWFNRFPQTRTVSYFQSLMHPHFAWVTPNGCPAHLPLYLLEEGNGQRLATQLSCGQEIAGDSAFSLGMVAEFDEPLITFGPWFYKRLFWETGLIGQVLYLEAEAAGIRATGIGCFFDNPVHEVLGFHPRTTLQSLYHFTMGGPVDDSRLTTLPPYGPPRT